MKKMNKEETIRREGNEKYTTDGGLIKECRKSLLIEHVTHVDVTFISELYVHGEAI